MGAAPNGRRPFWKVLSWRYRQRHHFKSANGVDTVGLARLRRVSRLSGDLIGKNFNGCNVTGSDRRTVLAVAKSEKRTTKILFQTARLGKSKGGQASRDRHDNNFNNF